MSIFSGYFQKIFRASLPEGKIRQQAYEEINRSLNRAFAQPSLKKYASSLSIRGLLIKAVEMFVGSQSIPKNTQLSRYLLETAEGRAKNPREIDEIEYYKYFFIRIDAFKTGKTEQFDMTSQVLNRLAEEKEHPQSCYLVGKQIMNIALTSNVAKERKDMFKLAAFYFQKSLTETNYGGLYYLGEIFRISEYSEVSEKDYTDFFTYGASLGDPLCYFRLSQIYLEKKEERLYLFYLKLAAESGVIQAQHNLGCQYLQGKRVAKDDVKALAWFMHAGANGYVESKLNVVQLFLHGSTCGRVKSNPKVALIKLEELKSSGEGVEDKIKEILESEEIKKLIKEQGERE